MQPLVFLATQDVASLGIVAGERIVVRPGATFPVVAQRELRPDFAALLRALAGGALEPIMPYAGRAGSRPAGGPDAPPPQSPRQPSPAPLLRRMK